MSKYRNMLTRIFDEDVGSIVGCGLDRTNQVFSWVDVSDIVIFYEQYKSKILTYPISTRREFIAEFAVSKEVSSHLQ